MSGQVYEAPRRGLNPRQVETVQKLMAAGLAELRETGRDAMTIRTVAQRAGVSPATAYTYLSSKNHLFAELFWRHLAADQEAPVAGTGVRERLGATFEALTSRIVEEPELAAAVTPALLGSDPDVERLRLRIGGEFVNRFERALRNPEAPDEPVDPAVLDALVLIWSGALLQAGMGVIGYDDIAERLASVVSVLLRDRA
ncbi:TetR/AcrR family transcriptional regulator [Nocardioides sambongensis]|uniref:TetR/AcrR family transcriptional regulator n=1 Tax=Nocardioides sambongensis TaxID=2589074 RepID=UPI0011264344|nr:TetR/AcrR family transcriptional regulator [Nocardioides sambongensis]